MIRIIGYLDFYQLERGGCYFFALLCVDNSVLAFLLLFLEQKLF